MKAKTTNRKNIFKEFDVLKNKMFQIMDNDGNIILPDWMPNLKKEMLIKAYEKMLYARTADSMAISYQRQGRMYTYPPNKGQEAIAVGTGMIMKAEDWLVPAFRELGAWLAKGATMKDVFLYFRGDEKGSIFPGASNMLPSSVPIASQCLHAVGIGYALKYKKQNGAAFVFFGDGGTSEGDFHEALNFAGVWKVPVVFICQNNQYAISLPRTKQTASKSLAIKAVGYGIEGIQVDGNDFFAVYRATAEASQYAKSGKGPVLIEAVTYRQGAHTTSDDPKKYRTTKEEEKWLEKDPLKRLKNYLIKESLWIKDQDEELIKKFKKEIDTQFIEAESTPYNIEEIFHFHYSQIPDDLKKQKIEYQKFLSWKESLK